MAALRSRERCWILQNQKLPLGSKSDPTYTEMGYRDWKRDLEKDCGLLELDAPTSRGKATALVFTGSAISKNTVYNNIIKNYGQF